MLVLVRVVRRGAGLRRAGPGLLRRFQLFDEFGGFFVEVFEATLTAEFDFPVLIREDVRVAHAAEFLAGDHAGFERIGFAFFRLSCAPSDRDQRSQGQGASGAENDFGDLMHIIHGGS